MRSFYSFLTSTFIVNRLILCEFSIFEMWRVLVTVNRAPSEGRDCTAKAMYVTRGRQTVRGQTEA